MAPLIKDRKRLRDIEDYDYRENEILYTNSDVEDYLLNSEDSWRRIRRLGANYLYFNESETDSSYEDDIEAEEEEDFTEESDEEEDSNRSSCSSSISGCSRSSNSGSNSNSSESSTDESYHATKDEVFHRKYQNKVGLIPVCIICSAQTIELAENMMKQWPHFPGFISIWGESITNESYPERGTVMRFKRFFFIQAHQTSHAEGWNMSYQVARSQNQYTCEYYFTMDDDLQWSVSESGIQYAKNLSSLNPSHELKSSILYNYLKEYTPAVTVFPWEWGDSNLNILLLLNRKYQNQVLQPASDFDNGCLIFHHSIVDFFIPLTLGGNFSAEFISQSSYLILYVPLLFRQYAIRFNGLTYFNPPAVRHRYESPDDYANYLSTGAKCPWGNSPEAYKRQWKPEKFQGNKHEITLTRIAAFMKLEHGSVQSSLYLTRKYKDRFSKGLSVLGKRIPTNCFEPW